MVICLSKMSLGSLSLTLAFCVTLTNLDVNLGAEALLRVGNMGVLPHSRAKVQTQLTPNCTVGGDAEMHLLVPSYAHPMQKPYGWVCTHVQCSIKFQNWTFMVCIMACHIRMLPCRTVIHKVYDINAQLLNLQFKTTESMSKRTEQKQFKYLQNPVHTDRVNKA